MIERGELIDEAPTYAAILGVEMPWAQGKAMERNPEAGFLIEKKFYL